MKKVLILSISLCFCFPAFASEIKVPLQSGLEIKPGEPMVVAIESDNPMEIGWTVNEATSCGSPCIDAIDVSSGNKNVLSSDIEASQVYMPKDGIIKIKYRNTVDRAVIIDVYKTEHICDSGAEACGFLKLNELGDRLVYKVDNFTFIQTSADGSYSTVEGYTTRGRRFSINVVWWVDDAEESPDRCKEDITRYVTEGTPIGEYTPYILSGRSAAKNKGVLAYVDACIPHGSDFVVPDKYVY